MSSGTTVTPVADASTASAMSLRRTIQSIVVIVLAVMLTAASLCNRGGSNPVSTTTAPPSSRGSHRINNNNNNALASSSSGNEAFTNSSSTTQLPEPNEQLPQTLAQVFYCGKSVCDIPDEKRSDVRVSFIGDSLTVGYEPRQHKLYVPYTAHIEYFMRLRMHHYSDCVKSVKTHVFPAAAPGAAVTGGTLFSLEPKYSPALRKSVFVDPHVIVAMLGTNDACLPRMWRDTKSFLRGYRSLILAHVYNNNKSSSSLRHVFIVVPPPIAFANWSVFCNRKAFYDIIVPQVRNLSADWLCDGKCKVHVIDAHKTFLAAAGFTSSSSSSGSSEGTADQDHHHRQKPQDGDSDEDVDVEKQHRHHHRFVPMKAAYENKYWFTHKAHYFADGVHLSNDGYKYLSGIVMRGLCNGGEF